MRPASSPVSACDVAESGAVSAVVRWASRVRATRRTPIVVSKRVLIGSSGGISRSRQPTVSSSAFPALRSAASSIAVGQRPMMLRQRCALSRARSQSSSPSTADSSNTPASSDADCAFAPDAVTCADSASVTACGRSDNAPGVRELALRWSAVYGARPTSARPHRDEDVAARQEQRSEGVRGARRSRARAPSS